MPPMMTTIRALRRKSASSPGAITRNAAASDPPSPARAEPRKNEAALTAPMLMPRAEVIARSSTPARTIIPKRVFLMARASPTPTATATASTKSLNQGNVRQPKKPQ